MGASALRGSNCREVVQLRNVNWLLLFILLAGLVLGGFIGEVLGGYPALSWLNYGKEFGVNPEAPLVLNFYIFRMTFGLMIKINIASIIGVLLSLFLYKLFRK